MGKKLIELKNITKRFGDLTVLDRFSLYINENEFITLLGPSGCGKTTCLRLIGGFEMPDAGDIIFDGKIINDLEPNQHLFSKIRLIPPFGCFWKYRFWVET